MIKHNASLEAAIIHAEATKVNFPVVQMGTIDGEQMQTVNMRDLHEKLGVKREFSHWVQDVVEGFTRGEDYEVFVKNGENPTAGGRPRKEYVATLDVAKHAAMLSRTDAGKKIRQHFINVEKDWRLSHHSNNLPTLTTEEMIAAIANNAAKHARELAETKALAVETKALTDRNAERLDALESTVKPGVTMNHRECPADSEIKSRAVRRKHKETGMSLAICEKVFELYAENMWKGETCVNPNPTVPGTKACRVYKIKDVNAAFRHFLRFVKPLGNGLFMDKDIASRFRVPCLAE